MCARFTKVCIIILICAGLTARENRNTFCTLPTVLTHLSIVLRLNDKPSINLILSLKLIFERVRITYLNDKYVQYAFVNVSRYERKGDYNVNLEFIPKYPFSNDLMINMLFYEFLSYRYERSFVELHYKLCDFLNVSLVGAQFRRKGLKCPAIPGKLYSYNNFTVNLDSFPNVFPFEKGLVKIVLHMTDSVKTRISEGLLYLTFKNTNKEKKRN